MAWDSKASRRRQNSTTAGRSTNKNAATETFIPKSTHVSDPSLQPFLAPSFDAAEYLNATLPSLATTPISNTKSQDVTLAELSTHTQTLLSHLSAHTTRLTSILTHLTDEILRSGSRLAYEVEVLRGETIGLSEALTEGLQDDISNFVPEGLETHLAPTPLRLTDANSNEATRRRSSTIVAQKSPVEEQTSINKDKIMDPAYINQLRTLTSVRDRLETVIKAFGDAMSWTFPPSEVSVSSAFLSVSAPEPGSEAHSIEEKGQQVSKKLKDEIAYLLMGAADPVDGIESAAKRVEELKELAEVWRGTAEEKARGKFVESLARMVEERHRELLREVEEGRSGGKESRSEVARAIEASIVGESKSQSGYGFMSQLSKMRGGL